MRSTGEGRRPDGDRHLLVDIAGATLRRVAGRTGGVADAGAEPGAGKPVPSGGRPPSGERIADGGQTPSAGQVVDGWEIRPGEPWTYVAPAGSVRRAQGWKLHVSATPLSAPVVLARVVEVLGRRRCSFKFAATLDELGALLAREQDRGSVGKFVTVYPPDDETAVVVAEELHRATSGLPGPPILSDRAYRPGSLVHYRFGVFSALDELDNDGTYTSRLTAPDGTRVTDERKAWYSPPAWAHCPFESGGAPARISAPEAVLLAGRFVVRQAFRHSAKGGIFLAEDQVTGGQVVIKQARPHLLARLDGQDARDRLRHEARMLDLFAPLGVTARKVALFEQDGNLFLAQDHLSGTVLTGWVDERRLSPPDPDRHTTLAGMARRLAARVAVVHGQGYVLRDLTPNNIVVVGDDCLLIDLEMAGVPGTPEVRAFTPGYAPPEQIRGADHGPVPGPEADLFALGATVFHMVTGCQPVLAEDRPAGARPWDERLEALVGVAVAGDPTATALAPLFLGLMRQEPEQRWDMERVRAFLDDVAAVPVSPAVLFGTPNGHRPGTAEQDRLLGDGLAHVLRTMSPAAVADPEARAPLWAGNGPAGYGATTDPCAVQYGSAGVLTLLASLAGHGPATGPTRPEDTGTPQDTGAPQDTGTRQETGTPENTGAPQDSGTSPDTGTSQVSRAELLAGLGDAAGWTARRLAAERRPSPGLYFGRAGIAWGLYEAGRALGDGDLRARGVDLALDLPVNWPNPDVCHGLAGTALALLHFWHATGDARFRERAGECADALLKAARRTPEAVLWPIPEDFDSGLAGVVHYGFAHGVAGIGASLLAAGIALGREEYLETAVAAGETLLAVADRHGGAARWASGPGGEERLPHWCSGSSGVGTFLIRLYAATGDPRLLDAARGAAVAVHAYRRSAGTAACHGLAGDGQFLLDMADILGEPVYRELAEDLAGFLWARAVVRDGLLVVPDESTAEVTVGWNTGLAGVLDFLHRLRHGGPRSWMADPPGDGPRALVTIGPAR